MDRVGNCNRTLLAFFLLVWKLLSELREHHVSTLLRFFPFNYGCLTAPQRAWRYVSFSIESLSPILAHARVTLHSKVASVERLCHIRWCFIVADPYGNTCPLLSRSRKLITFFSILESFQLSGYTIFGKILIIYQTLGGVFPDIKQLELFFSVCLSRSLCIPQV